MHRSWKSLSYTTDDELRDPKRVRQVIQTRQHAPLSAILGFFIAGIIAIAFSGYIFVGLWEMGEVFSGVIGALLCFLTGLGAVWSARISWTERARDPLWGYLIHPEEFDFCSGKILRASYIAHKRRRSAKILVEGVASLPNGQEEVFFENFSPETWNEKIGNGAKLPLTVAIIYKKADPEICALIGVRAIRHLKVV